MADMIHCLFYTPVCSVRIWDCSWKGKLKSMGKSHYITATYITETFPFK